MNQHPQWNAAGRWAAAQSPQPWPYQDEQTTHVTHTGVARPGAMRNKLTVTLAAIALGLGGGATWAALTTTSAEASEVRLEAVSTAGDSPFLPPVGQDKIGVTPPADIGGTFTGDTAGLYAEDDSPSCDTKKLVSGLDADEAKAAAWSAALGIEPVEIKSFVGGLSPVLLRADTAVTNYGFRGGSFAPSQSVLQAGTAVLINGYGEPTVKCFSGNPLTKPVEYAPEEVAYVGPKWGHWEPRHCTFVAPTKIVIKKHVFVHVDKNHKIEKPGKPFPHEPNPGPHMPEHKPDPVLEAAAKEARMKADTAAMEAKDRREAADSKAIEARIFDTEARNLEDKAKTAQDDVAKAKAKLDATTDPVARAAAQAELDKAELAAADADTMAKDARSMAEEKANQAKYAESAARSAEGTQAAAEKNAEEAEEKATGSTKDTTTDQDGTDGQATTEQAGTEQAGTAGEKSAAGKDTTEQTAVAGATAGGGQATTPGTGTTEGTTTPPGTAPAGTDDAGTTPATKADDTEAGATEGETTESASPFMKETTPAGPGTQDGPPAGTNSTQGGPPAGGPLPGRPNPAGPPADGNQPGGSQGGDENGGDG